MKTTDEAIEALCSTLTQDECVSLGVYEVEDAINRERNEVAKLLDTVSLWLTGEGRALVDANRNPQLYAPALEGVIADVEAMRAKMDPNA